MSEQNNDGGRPPFNEQIATVLYPVFMTLLLAVMSASAAIAATIVVHVRMGITEPSWIKAVMPGLEAMARVYDASEGDAARMLDTIYIAVTALVMGVFLRRCAERRGRVELLIVLGLLFLVVVQLVTYALLPDKSVANESLDGGWKMIENLKLILVRNSNVALAVFAAAVGIQIRTKPEVKEVSNA